MNNRRRPVDPWEQLHGLLPAALVVFWLSLSTTPITTGGALSIGALALCGWHRLREWSVLLAAPAALAVGASTPHREDWVPLVVALFVWRGAVSTAQLDEELEGTGLTPVLYAISAVGAYLCLPDTEQIIPLAVVAVLAAVVAVAQPDAAFGRPGSMALIGLLGWIAAAGGIGRSAATIGGLGTFGVLVLAGGLALPPYWLLVATQSGCVAICSRIAGISHDVQFAVLVVGLALSATFLAVVLSARR
jgi:hypothetical protein